MFAKFRPVGQLRELLDSGDAAIARWLLQLPLPRSIARLVLTGFTLVVLPLVITVVLVVYQLNQLVVRSEQLVIQGSQVTSRSEQLFELLADMENNAHQYLVSGDPELFERYREKHGNFITRLNLLKLMGGTDFAPELIATIHEKVSEALILLHNAGTGPDLPGEYPAMTRDLMALFTDLQSQTRILANSASRLIDDRIKSLFETTYRTNLTLYWLAGILISLALLTGTLFIVLITRPVQQLRSAIQTLGNGRLESPIAIAGPQELQRVGQQLDWLRNRLLALEEQKNRFLRHVSHELKTPLASIREGTELLADGTVGPLNQSQHEVMTIVRENSVELQSLIENLLDFNAWQQHRSSFQPQHLNLLELLHGLCEQHRLALNAKQLRVRLPETVPELLADADLLTTALDNLLSNAIKFSPPGGTISILVRSTWQQVIIEMIDCGPGVPAELGQRIFEPFVKGTTPSGGRLPGTGIGLSIARECIEAHNGTIELTGDAPGAHFRIILPGAS